MVAVAASLLVAVAPMVVVASTLGTAVPTVAVVASETAVPMGPVVAWPVGAVVAVLAVVETSMWHLGPPVSEGETDTCGGPCKGLPKIAKTVACASTASARSRTSGHCTSSK